MTNEQKSGATTALVLLLAINLFNYIDRQVLSSVEPEIRHTFFASGDPNAMEKTGWLAPAFLVSYMISAPIFGWLADRMSRAGLGSLAWGWFMKQALDGNITGASPTDPTERDAWVRQGIQPYSFKNPVNGEWTS